MLKYVDGDLLALGKAGEFDVIAHGCNCQNNMGSGIAKQIRQQFPEAWKADQKTKKGDKKKLGCAEGTVIDDLIVVNAYTQFTYGGGKCHADYKAIKNVMAEINWRFKGMRVGLPKIGAGLAGGDWDLIEAIIEEELADVDVTIVNYAPGK